MSKKEKKKKQEGQLNQEQKTVTGADRQRRPIFKRKRGGQVLTRTEVKEIKAGRKSLRKEMKKRGIKSRKEFETTASSLGLYFDRGPFLGLLWWLSGRGLLALLAAAALLLGALGLLSLLSQIRGNFTINLTDGMLKEGVSLSETPDFENPVDALFAKPALDVPDYSISWFEDDLDTGYYGNHNADYFAYTFFLQYQGDGILDYVWTLNIDAESQNLSDAAWVMVFEDGEMSFYAKADPDGDSECLPARDDDTRGYVEAPLIDFSANPEEQYEIVKESGGITFYRVIPYKFITDTLVATGEVSGVASGEVHRYTVVIWLEGDDPQCTDELVGGHLGLDMQFSLTSELMDETDGSESTGGLLSRLTEIWNNLKWW